MDQREIYRRLEEAIDTLADLEHQRWAHWQQYLHRKATRCDDGSLLIPADLVAQWERQIATPFNKLSEKEQESDRDQVRTYIPAISRILGD
jgi:hypothetical protein